MTREEIRDFFNSQIHDWDLARKNFEALSLIKKKPFKIKDMEGWVQFNPARAVSTLANLDKKTLEKRPCFLCECNRPKEQKKINIEDKWDLLVNPFPILPYHFTIASGNHSPQFFDLSAGMSLAETLQGMVVFFNGEGAGASAPDHLHYQAVPMDSLPLINVMEKGAADKIKLNFPFEFILDTDHFESEDLPVNAYFWVNKEGKNRNLIIKRKAHRPEMFYLDPPYRRAVSPGAIDMAGVIVTPYEDDFNRINGSDIETIYKEVTL